MSTRKAISQKIRYEVFKRDKFRCQYCGKTTNNSEDVKLQVDHIVPVFEGGTNELLNLITSCFECNIGKGKRKLSDDTVIMKQKKQLDDLQDIREQNKQIYEWKKELEKIDDEKIDMLINYVNGKLIDSELNQNGKNKILNLSKKFQLEELFEGIDKSANIYLKLDKDGYYTHESVSEFINKIGGILANKKKSPIEQKLNYIRGIGVRRFSSWSDKSGFPILHKLVSFYQKRNLSDEMILAELDKVIEFTKYCKSWTAWKEKIENIFIEIPITKKQESHFVDDEVKDKIFNNPIFQHNEFISFLTSTIYMFKNMEEFNEKKFQLDFKKYRLDLINHLITRLKNGDRNNYNIKDNLCREAKSKMFLFYQNYEEKYNYDIPELHIRPMMRATELLLDDIFFRVFELQNNIEFLENVISLSEEFPNSYTWK